MFVGLDSIAIPQGRNYAPPGVNATPVGSPVWMNGRHDGYVDLNVSGSGSYMEVADHSAIDIGTQDLTILAWIRPEANALTGVTSIVDKRSNENDNSLVTGYTLFLQNGRLSLQLASNGFSNRVSNYNLVAGQWQFVAVTVDRDLQGRFYLDGSACEDAPAHSTFVPAFNGASLSNTANLRIGQHASTTFGADFHGGMDEVMVFSRALTPGEIASIFMAGTTGVDKGIPDHISTNFCWVDPWGYTTTANDCISHGPATTFLRGDTSISTNDVYLITTGLPANTFALHIWSTSPRSAPFLVGNCGLGLCLDGQLRRFQAKATQGCGVIVDPLDLGNLPGNVSASLGDVYYYQCWFRSRNLPNCTQGCSFSIPAENLPWTG